MTNNFSYTGSHPLEAVVKDLTTDRDEWKARALAAEAEAAQLRADLGAADDIMQPALVTVAPDTANGGGAYQE